MSIYFYLSTHLSNILFHRSSVTSLSKCKFDRLIYYDLKIKLISCFVFKALASMEDNEEPDEDEADPVLEPETETKPAVSKSPGSIFSGSSGTGTGLFGGGGGSSSTAPAKNLFGGGGSTIFGGSSTSAAASIPPTGLFGTPTTVKSTSIFGGSSSTPGGSIFGGSTGGAVGSTSSGSIFGGSGSSAAAKPSLFGGSSGGEGLFGAASSGSGTFAFGTPKSGTYHACSLLNQYLYNCMDWTGFHWKICHQQ